jgi:arylsulfatase
MASKLSWSNFILPSQIGMAMIENSTRRYQRIIIVFGVGLVLALICVRQSFADEQKANVLILMADDLGFSDLGCYGSEIATPVLDALASTGIVFSDFHTAPTCSPTRAMLLTGVDHHLAGMGNMYEFLNSAPAQLGKPGYEGHLNDSVVTIAEVLKTAGYHTAISGKWHLGRQLVVPQAPVARGFDQSWVLWSGWAEHHAPADARTFVEGKSRSPYPQGRYSTELYTDKAIEFADEAINQDEPFFLFVSYTAPHWPLEAPADLIAKQKGNYDDGYDELRKRRMAGLVEKGILPRDIQAAATPARRPHLHHQPPSEKTRSWDELASEERAYSARLMEVHAAMIESLDLHVGRLLKHLQSRDQLNNTLVIFLSDNGAAPMASTITSPGNHLENVGRPGSFVGYGPEWARASTGPLRLMKGHATEGGTRVPAIIKLPNSVEHRVTAEFASVLDIAPTIYQLTDATYPKTFQDHDLHLLNGVSMLPYMTGEHDQIHDDDDSMGWELFGRSAFRHGKWKITWIEKPFGSSDFELFNMETDPGETRNVRAMYPVVYQQMVEGFDEYGRTNGIVIARPQHWR